MSRPEIIVSGENCYAGIAPPLDMAHEMTIRFSDGSKGTVHFDDNERAVFHTALVYYGAAPADVAAVVVNGISVVGGHCAYA